ncbi:MAG: hypothetical protein AB1705_25120 [Verrucomicrobiota bacterium]
MRSFLLVVFTIAILALVCPVHPVADQPAFELGQAGPSVATDIDAVNPNAADERQVLDAMDIVQSLDSSPRAPDDPKKGTMHYKNGREAKNGDKVVLIPAFGPPVAGILYDATPGSNDYCNGKIAITSQNDPSPNLKECLHADDVAAATIPDSSKPS